VRAHAPGRWRSGADGALTRVFTFVQPKKGVASCPTHCTQRQRLSVHEDGGVVALATDTQTAHIPCADAFRVQSFWTVRAWVFEGRCAPVWHCRPGECRKRTAPHSNAPRRPPPPPPPLLGQVRPGAHGAGCRVEIRVAVPFSRWCMLQGVITKASFSDCKDFFSGYLDSVSRAVPAAAPPAASPFAAVAGAAPPDAGLGLLARRPWRAARPPAAPSKPRLGAPEPHPLRPPGASTRALVRLHTALLVALLLLQALVLWEMFLLRRRLAVAHPGGDAGLGAVELLLAVGARAAGGASAGLSGAAAWARALAGAAGANGHHGASVVNALVPDAPGAAAAL
jgi:hypothetical protein